MFSLFNKLFFAQGSGERASQVELERGVHLDPPQGFLHGTPQEVGVPRG